MSIGIELVEAYIEANADSFRNTLGLKDIASNEYNKLENKSKKNLLSEQENRDKQILKLLVDNGDKWVALAKIRENVEYKPKVHMLFTACRNQLEASRWISEGLGDPYALAAEGVTLATELEINKGDLNVLISKKDRQALRNLNNESLLDLTDTAPYYDGHRASIEELKFKNEIISAWIVSGGSDAKSIERAQTGIKTLQKRVDEFSERVTTSADRDISAIVAGGGGGIGAIDKVINSVDSIQKELGGSVEKIRSQLDKAKNQAKTKSKENIIKKVSPNFWRLGNTTENTVKALSVALGTATAGVTSGAILAGSVTLVAAVTAAAYASKSTEKAKEIVAELESTITGMETSVKNLKSTANTLRKRRDRIPTNGLDGDRNISDSQRDEIRTIRELDNGPIDEAIKDNAGKAADSIRRFNELKAKDSKSRLSLEERLELAALDQEDVLRRRKNAILKEAKGQATSDFIDINLLDRENYLNTTKAKQRGKARSTLLNR